MAKKIDLKILLEKDFKEVKKDLNFEDGVILMEELTEQVESGELPLEESVNAYEVGSNLIKHLKSMLDSAEKKLKVIPVKK